MERVYKCMPFDVELAKKIQSGEVKGKISDFEGIILYDYITEIENGCIIQQRSKDIPNAYGRNGQCLDNVNKDILYIFIELPEETQKHNFIVGDLVKIHCEGDQYDNKIGEVVDVFTNTLRVRVEALPFPYKINDVEFIAPGRVNNSVTGEATKHEFKPFEKVLARDNDSQEWTVDFYSHKINNMHICIGTVWTHQVIPYEGNEHLVGTTNNPKYLWES